MDESVEIARLWVARVEADMERLRKELSTARWALSAAEAEARQRHINGL